MYSLIKFDNQEYLIQLFQRKLELFKEKLVLLKQKDRHIKAIY